MSDVTDLQKRAMLLRERYNEINDRNGYARWNGQDYTSGLVGDVGDLIKIVMAKENKRSGSDIDDKLRHELGDILWSLFVIAETYNINLEQAFYQTMQELEQRLAA
ncbi:nucleotide pyrophosphohydrolase [Candidatus Saccharibacteria bacterium]|jgi:NTP pyrophosphatase (non-canonical NTP hydrolase)|nr:nucleotide pyrophosphohydrolase [Candidatus Saccharibacteria bacterium]HPR09509.1 MazG nucleotide pyrophosphohydrolase domain-containing protein [Candidatus Saccharibacteria bacterium]